MHLKTFAHFDLFKSVDDFTSWNTRYALQWRPHRSEADNVGEYRWLCHRMGIYHNLTPGAVIGHAATHSVEGRLMVNSRGSQWFPLVLAYKRITQFLSQNNNVKKCMCSRKTDGSAALWEPPESNQQMTDSSSRHHNWALFHEIFCHWRWQLWRRCIFTGAKSILIYSAKPWDFVSDS